jgi:hypothetical protein
MKTFYSIFKIIAGCFVLIFLSTASVNGQCVSPVMTYRNSTLISGTAGQVNAKYKFPSVTPGVDAIISINEIAGGATLTSIDDNVFGYDAAWQPVVHTKNTAGAGESYISFRIDFVQSSNNNSSYTYNCFALSFIDIDGDNDKVREFIETKQFDSYQLSSNSLLQISQNSGFTRAIGPVLNYPDLDTSSYPTNIVFKFTNKNQVQEIRIGNKVDNNFIPQDRYNLGYFTPMVFPAAPLPVKYRSFTASLNDNDINLNWITENEINNSHFEIQRSFNGTAFTTAGVTADAINAGNGSKAYSFNDKSAVQSGLTTVYYRLKQFDKDGKFIYSEVLVVKLQPGADTKMQVSPNPFAENLNVSFTALQKGTVQIQVLSVTGQKVMSMQVAANKGVNTLKVMNINKLAPGFYLAQLVIDGTITETQKIIKN